MNASCFPTTTPSAPAASAAPDGCAVADAREDVQRLVRAGATGFAMLTPGLDLVGRPSRARASRP